MKKRILVTGSNGFTGRYVCAELKRRGHEVYGLTNNLSVSGRSIDLRDRHALHEAILTLRPEGVIHLAAVAYVDHGCEEDFFDVNVVGTKNLLESLSKLTNLESVIIASSANVYGNSLFGEPINEDVSLDPQNFYAVSKVKMEQIARLEFEYLPVTIVRPFNYTGRGQSESYLLPKIVGAYRRRDNVLHLGNLNVYRDFSDVRYVAWVYAELVEKTRSVDLLNICSGKAYCISDLLNKCSNLSGHCLEVVSDENARRRNEVFFLLGDPGRLLRTVGEGPRYSIDDTLSWMLS